ncbi:MAG: 16S rRNA (cytidine(1402)-2'-O)-methyltransferase [Bryobacteraceae bacterium]|nr:16S rRNA (cytidine(1402)-2'-O)-methyltransferase [Bryobacteraceae bacterium]
MTGTLYLVATPIGNLEDISFRALRILKQAALIACEDTRQTRKLLNHYAIRTPLVSYHEHNEAERTPELLAKLRAGDNIALVSDAGTPLVSDPGYRLVERAVAEGVPVVPVPGPSAVLAALTASGLATDQFHFAGFLPAGAGQRRKTLEKLRDVDATLVFYEAPHRILRTLADLEEILGERPLVVAREITKIHEEFLRGTPASVRAELERRGSIRGEFTVVVGRAAPASSQQPLPLAEAVEECVRAGMTRMEAIKAVARRTGLSKREVYKAAGRRTLHPQNE